MEGVHNRQSRRDLARDLMVEVGLTPDWMNRSILHFSGGQRQRLALARALLAAKDVGLVLLDEATSSVDASTEAEIYDRLTTAFAGACIVSSVHRLHLLPRFDTVLLMEHGRIVDSGTPDEVKQRRPELFAHSAAAVAGETRAA